MSLSSARHSFAGRTRPNGVTDEAVYQYALRIAYLAYLMRPRPAEAIPEDESPSGAEPPSSRGHTARIQEAFKMPDFTSMFMGNSSSGGKDKSSKFPDKTFKALDTKLKAIWMNRDPSFSDARIRATVATFWGNMENDPSFLRGVRENRKIEELILMFVSVATKELQKEDRRARERNQVPDFEWKYELNVQVGQIVRILRDTLKNVSGVSSELMVKLDGYSEKLASAPSKPPPPPVSSNPTPSSNGNRASVGRPKPLSMWHSSDPKDMPMVQVVGALFGRNNAELAEDLEGIKRTCTVKAAMNDLKTCLKNINAGLAFPAAQDDFDSEEAWNTWRQAEVAHLSQLVMMMVQLYPELAKESSAELPSLSSVDRPGLTSHPSNTSELSAEPSTYGQLRLSDGASRTPSVQSHRSLDADSTLAGVDLDEVVAAGHDLTYVPPQPRPFYKRLLEVAIDCDINNMANLPQDEEVDLSILSASHVELLNECALRWRIGQPYRLVAFLDVLRHKNAREEAPPECVIMAIERVMGEARKTPPHLWPWQDSSYLVQILNAIWEHFLRQLRFSLESYNKKKQADIQEELDVLEALRSTELVGDRDVDRENLDEIANVIRQQAFELYSTMTTEVFSADSPNEVEPLLTIIDWVEKQGKLALKRFPKSIFGRINIVEIVLGQHVPLLLQDLEDAHTRILEDAIPAPTRDMPDRQPKVEVDEVFGLYRRSMDTLAMLESYAPDSGVSFEMGAFFEPFVLKWLSDTDALTAKWAAEAIKVDNFEPDGHSMNSSSIVDVFRSFSSAVDFLYSLEWPDLYQEAQFLTALAKTLSKLVEQYCNAVEEEFLSEMFPRAVIDPSIPKENAWIVKARLALQGEKAIEPFNFIPASCVKLNNIETGRIELERMNEKMRVDEVTQIIREEAPTVPAKNEPERFLFTVKVVLAEGLIGHDRDPTAKLDTFVTISDEHGNRLAKTRTIYETIDPRWDQTFDISVPKGIWVMATVRDRNLIGKHDEIGRAYIRLDPKKYGDFLAHDVWYNLEEKTGRLLLRISMEGEKDEIGFYFGRAFRTLKRAENDMIRTFVAKMSPFIRQSLSMKVIKALIKPPTAPVDYNAVANNAVHKLTDRFRSALGSSNEPAIPLPKDEIPLPPPKPKGYVLTDADIEDAIAPLLDYLDVNMATLSSSLTLSALHAVFAKTWKEILSILEALLVPPLSAAPTDMRPLTDQEVDIVMKWCEFLRNFFHAGGDEKGLSIETLKNQKYLELMKIRLLYDDSTDELMMQCIRDSQAALRKAGTVKRAKSVFQQRSLGTIKDRKREKKVQGADGGNSADIILRILRMRPGTLDFIVSQIEAKAAIEAASSAPSPQLITKPTGRSRLGGGGGTKRTSRYGGGGGGIPEVPSIPAVHASPAHQQSQGRGGYQLRDG